MSYCHDLLLDGDFCRDAFAAAAQDVRTLIRRSEIEVVGPSGRPDSLPIVEEFRIAFNGVDENCICGSVEAEIRPRCPPECYGGQWLWISTGQAFDVDVRPSEAFGGVKPRGGYPKASREGRYWFDCKTHYKPYDKMVQMAMMALKHHLGNSIELHSKGNWSYSWGAGSDRGGRGVRIPHGAVAMYEHIFPERAPVQNILDGESVGW